MVDSFSNSIDAHKCRWALAGISSSPLLTLCIELTGTYILMLYLYVILMLVNVYLLTKLNKGVFEYRSDLVDIKE